MAGGCCRLDEFAPLARMTTEGSKPPNCLPIRGWGVRCSFLLEAHAYSWSTAAYPYYPAPTGR